MPVFTDISFESTKRAGRPAIFSRDSRGNIRRKSASESAFVRLPDDVARIGTAHLAEIQYSYAPGVIHSNLWEWLTGSSKCCRDCLQKHRDFGVPCDLDWACCGGSLLDPICHSDPRCKGGHTGGPGGIFPGGGTSTDVDDCGLPYEVQGAVTNYNGSTCYFDGTVVPTWVDHECVLMTGAGVVYGCEDDVMVEEAPPPEKE